MSRHPVPITLVLATICAGPALSQDLDAVAAAPGNHRVILENDDVRVLEVTVAPGETEPVHEHRWPSVMHIQTPQPFIDIVYKRVDGRLVEDRRIVKRGITPPPALWFGPQEPHATRNTGTQTFRALRVELKRGASAAPVAAPH